MLNCRLMDLKVVTTKTIMNKLLVQYSLTNPDVMRPELISTSESGLARNAQNCKGNRSQIAIFHHFKNSQEQTNPSLIK